MTLKPVDVRYIAVEGGGAGGLFIHPGALEALESLQIIRTEDYKPVSIQSWSGSSSGSVISTLASSGYTSAEITVLASQEAADMVFRLEKIQVGETAKLFGQCAAPLAGMAFGEPNWPTLIADWLQYSDYLGGVLDLVHMVRGPIAQYVETSRALYNSFLTDQDQRVSRIQADAATKRLASFDALKKAAEQEYAARLKKWSSPPASASLLAQNEYPTLVFRLIDHLAGQATGKIKGSSLYQILKYDLGLVSGCAWRDYFDHALAFARFRSRFMDTLPSLALPAVADMASAGSLEELFHATIDLAIQADQPADDPADIIRAYDLLRHCTFRQHYEEFYQSWLPQPIVPPLILTQANIVTQESHVFSSFSTPDFEVADAVRMATGLPPVFKPFLIEKGDIPGSWPFVADRFGVAHFLEGLWVDGGLYYNSPFEVFKEAASSFTGEANALALGAGIEARAQMDTLTRFAQAFINMGYEANISSSRINLANYLNVDKFNVGFAKPRLTPSVLAYYRLDAYWRMYQFFGLDPGL